MGALVAAAHPLPLPEPGMDLLEGRPPVGQLMPALHHEGVHPAWAVFWTGEQLPASHHLNYFLV